MSKTKSITIRCEHCKGLFPSKIWIGESSSFDVAQITGNKQQCDLCGELTGCNKDNFRAVFEDGGFVGNLT